MQPDESLAQGRADRFRRPQRVRLHHQGNRRGPRLGRRSTASPTATPPARSSTTRTARSWRTWTSCRSSPRSTSATCASRTISSATCCTPTCRSTPAAAANRAAPSACGRRPSAGTATACARPGTWPRRSRWRSAISRRCGSSSSTTTPSPTTCRAPRRSRSELGKLGVTWSCNAKANVPRETLKVLKDNGLRLLLVGYESGNQQILHNIKKGMRIEVAKRFTKDCHELGIKIHGTFILGLPGETKETIEETIRFATEINPHTIQVSLAAPYPGTFLYKQAVENGWLDADARRAGRRPRHPDRAAALSASVAHGDLRQRRDVLQALLFPRAEDRLDRRRDGAQPADDEAPAARGRGVLPVPARAAQGGVAAAWAGIGAVGLPPIGAKLSAGVALSPSWPGLTRPPTHGRSGRRDANRTRSVGVDGRVKPGHDENCPAPPAILAPMGLPPLPLWAWAARGGGASAPSAAVSSSRGPPPGRWSTRNDSRPARQPVHRLCPLPQDALASLAPPPRFPLALSFVS